MSGYGAASSVCGFFAVLGCGFVADVAAVVVVLVADFVAEGSWLGFVVSMDWSCGDGFGICGDGVGVMS